MLNLPQPYPCWEDIIHHIMSNHIGDTRSVPCPVCLQADPPAQHYNIDLKAFNKSRALISCATRELGGIPLSSISLKGFAGDLRTVPN